MNRKQLIVCLQLCRQNQILSFITFHFPFSVLDLDAFERINKAEGLGMSSDACSGEKNLEDAATTCKLFRFLQLLCEGHNLGMSGIARKGAHTDHVY